MKNILEKLASIADEADAAGQFKIANDLDNVIKVLAQEDMSMEPGPETGMSMEVAPPKTTYPVLMNVKQPPSYGKPNRSPDVVRKVLKYQDPATTDQEKAKMLSEDPSLRKHLLVALTEEEKKGLQESLAKEKADQKRKQFERYMQALKDRLQSTVEAYKAAGKPAPFTLPTGQLTHKDLLAILDKANRRSPEPKTFRELVDRVRKLGDLASVYANVLGARDPEKDPFKELSTAVVTAPENFQKSPETTTVSRKESASGQAASVPLAARTESMPYTTPKTMPRGPVRK